MSYNIPYIKLSVELGEVVTKSVDIEEALYNLKIIYMCYKKAKFLPMYEIKDSYNILLTRSGVDGEIGEILNAELYLSVIDRLKNYR